MTDTDRQRLAAVLGMLGSEHAGERAAAALQAEAFRNKHGLTWEGLLAAKPTPAAAVPEPPQWTPPPEPEPYPAASRAEAERLDAARFMTGYVAFVVAVVVGLAFLIS